MMKKHPQNVPEKTSPKLIQQLKDKFQNLSTTKKIITITLFLLTSFIFLCCCSFTTLLIAIWDDPSIILIHPSAQNATSDEPTYRIRLECNQVESIYLNDEKLSGEGHTSICGKGLTVDLKDGDNKFTVKATNQDNTTEKTFTISFDEEEYNDRQLAEQKDTREELIEAVQEKIDEAKDYNIDTQTYENSINNFNLDTSDITEIQDQCSALAVMQDEITQLVDEAESAEYEVKEVVDGDTLKIQYKGKLEKVRLIGIDSPELSGDDDIRGCLAKEAKAKLSELTKGQKIKIQFDFSQGYRDKYDRLLLYIWLSDNDLFVNESMIEEGFAYEYTYDTPYVYQSDFKEAEKQAEDGLVGLWGEACECADRKGEEQDRSCIACHKAEASYLDWDCSTYTSEITDNSCTSGCSTYAPPSSSGGCMYSCVSPDRDCADFSTHAQAQAFFNCCGFTATNDPMRLDGLGVDDGIACESLP